MKGVNYKITDVYCGDEKGRRDIVTGKLLSMIISDLLRGKSTI